jgi:two-component system, cell cycle sensor histidine kinase and response regulator CckA
MSNSPTKHQAKAPADKNPTTTAEMSVDGHSACLIVVSGPKTGRSYRVKDSLLIGRDLDCDIRVESKNVSRHHARLRHVSSGTYALEDLKSRNGSTINGFLVDTRILHYGDRVSIGGECLLLYTKHDQMHDQLQNRQKMEAMGQLVGGIAHDFNNLIGTILANVSVLLSAKDITEFEPDEVVDMLTDIRMASKRSAELTSQLLSFARPSKNEDLPVDFSSLVREVIRLCQRTLGAGLTLRAEVEPDLVVRGDRSQLHQVIMNLVINSRDATPAGGTITVVAKSFETTIQSVMLSVIDTGIGMDQETQERVFEPFFTTKRDSGGSGLGLASVHSIIGNHGGEIRLHSVADEGTRFDILFPKELTGTSMRRSADTMEVSSMAGFGHEHNALIIDKDDLSRRSVVRLLKNVGYTVNTANDSAAAYEYLASSTTPTNLVLLDVLIAKVDKESTCLKIRDFDSKINIIGVSCQTNPEREQKILAEGAGGILKKPFDRVMLQAAIALGESIS